MGRQGFITYRYRTPIFPFDSVPKLREHLVDTGRPASTSMVPPETHTMRAYVGVPGAEVAACLRSSLRVYAAKRHFSQVGDAGFEPAISSL